MLQKMLLDNFTWVENKDFIEKCNEDSDEGYFFEVDVQYLERLHDLHNDLPFLPGTTKIKKLKNLYPTSLIKKNMLNFI